MVRLPYSTPNATIAHIIHMKDYITFKTVEVQAQFFQQLEATETMRAYISHNMDENEELIANLETTRSEATIAQKLAKWLYPMRRACPGDGHAPGGGPSVEDDSHGKQT
ncbi:hypothetical protein CK203_033826 [Vitis vinifera]|uniref:Uncharacterized protein n=1 Tax=Vitis vinifera TaxID=29760 RepID=A0A438IQH5_VITVI|nr:hypothetical protein CK203_033826 [Vitis vinifera]